MGVLLGAVRERDFIKWDWDVELGVITDSIIDREDEIRVYFESKSFRVELINPSYKGFKINLFYYENKYSLWGLYFDDFYLQRNTFKFPKKYFLSFDKIEFRSLNYKIPNNVNELLTYIYGDWKKPIRSSDKKEYFESHIFIKENIMMRLSSSPKIGHSISRKWHDPLHTGECHEKKQAQ